MHQTDYQMGNTSSLKKNRLYAINRLLVRPDVLGAKALYAQFITNFPEIMIR